MYRVFSYLLFLVVTTVGLSIVFMEKNLVPILPAIAFTALVYLAFIVYEVFSRFFLLKRSVHDKLTVSHPLLSSSINLVSFFVFLVLFCVVFTGSILGLGTWFAKNYGPDILKSFSASNEVSQLRSSQDYYNAKNTTMLTYLTESTFKDKFLQKNRQQYVSNIVTSNGIYVVMQFEGMSYVDLATPRVNALYTGEFASSTKRALGSAKHTFGQAFSSDDVIKRITLADYYPKCLKGLPIFVQTVDLESSKSVTAYYPQTLDIPSAEIDVNTNYLPVESSMSAVSYKDLSENEFRLTFTNAKGELFQRLFRPRSDGSIEVIHEL